MPTMFHHDSRDRTVAQAAAACDARDKFHVRIEEGRERAENLVKHLATVIPEDRLATHGRDLNFRWGTMASPLAIADPSVQDARQGLPLLDANEPAAAGMDGADDVARILDMVQVPGTVTDGTPLGTRTVEDDAPSRLLLDVSDHTLAIHNNALRQICGAKRTKASGASISVAYIRNLMESGEPALQRLCTEILNTHYKDTPISVRKSLIRSIDNEARGFLGSTYKRLDSLLLVQELLEAANKVGAVPVDSVITDTRIQLKLVLNRIFEPIDDSPMLIGLAWGTSDFGRGANCLALTLERLWCTNKATTVDNLREVHCGGNLSDDIAWSEDTRMKETAASAAKLRDTVAHMLSDDHIGRMTDAIRLANEKETTWQEFGAKIKANLTVAEFTKAEALFQSCQQAELLPPARSLWRASNVLSLIAQSADNTERKLELERLAGKVIETPALKINFAA